MTGARALIVNADDFGLSPGVNRGIVEAHERGIVTSASLMVRWPAAAEAAAYSRGHPRLSLGLHVDLGEWAYRGDAWVPLYQVVSPEDATAVGEEVAHQLQVFRRLTGRDPTHVDSHQHVHLQEPARSLLTRVCRELAVPLRACSPAIRYCGDFYGQGDRGEPYPELISVEGLARLLVALPPGPTELGCHAGYGDDLSRFLDTAYVRERAVEVAVLCDPRIRATLASLRIELHSFSSIALGQTGRRGASGATRTPPTPRSRMKDGPDRVPAEWEGP
jgi:predicted glycoside hydrolase/deacetylase ChbG (UPF0249 family)